MATLGTAMMNCNGCKCGGVEFGKAQEGGVMVCKWGIWRKAPLVCRHDGFWLGSKSNDFGRGGKIGQISKLFMLERLTTIASMKRLP
jgi:hypothetical protein